MNSIEVFTEYMDEQLYYEGFTDELLLNDPERFRFEYSEFVKLYEDICPCNGSGAHYPNAI